MRVFLSAGLRRGRKRGGFRVLAGDQMAAEAGMRVNVASLLALGDDTVELLGERKDGEALAQACAGARMLRSVCRSESDDLEVQMKGPGLPDSPEISSHFVLCDPTVVKISSYFLLLFGAKRIRKI